MNLFDVLFAKKLSGGGSPFPPVIKRVTGNPIELTDAASAPLVRCETEIVGSQDLHGYSKPWVGGANINKMPPGEAKSTSSYGVTITSDGNGIYTFVGTCTQDFEVTFDCDEFTIPSVDNSAFYLFNTQSNANTVFVFYENSTVLDTWDLAGINRVSTYTGMKGLSCNKYGMRLKNGVTYNLTIKPMLAVGTSYTEWTPYSNICPITAYTEGEIEVSDGDGNVTTHTTTFPSAIYRGSEDCVKGEVSGKKKMLTFNGSEGWTTRSVSVGTLYELPVDVEGLSGSEFAIESISNMYVNDSNLTNSGEFRLLKSSATVAMLTIHDDSAGSLANFKTFLSTNNLQLVYTLTNETTEQVTPTNLPIKSLSGYNHIESSTGDMTIDYITDAYQNFVNAVESALPNTRKGGVKAFDIFKTLDEPKTPEAPAEGEPEEKETEEGAKR